jgi:hypothetical protein
MIGHRVRHPLSVRYHGNNKLGKRGSREDISTEDDGAGTPSPPKKLLAPLCRLFSLAPYIIMHALAAVAKKHKTADTRCDIALGNVIWREKSREIISLKFKLKLFERKGEKQILQDGRFSPEP